MCIKANAPTLLNSCIRFRTSSTPGLTTSSESKLIMAFVASTSVTNVQDVVAQLKRRSAARDWLRIDRLQTVPACACWCRREWARSLESPHETMPGVKITTKALGHFNNAELWVELGLLSEGTGFNSLAKATNCIPCDVKGSGSYAPTPMAWILLFYARIPKSSGQGLRTDMVYARVRSLCSSLSGLQRKKWDTSSKCWKPLPW